jgi:SAM-dependent methyltransferase
MAVAQFTREYQTVRRAEGWGSLNGAYYRALPYRDLSGRHTDIWRIRARSFDTFLKVVVEPLETDSAADAMRWSPREARDSTVSARRARRPRPARRRRLTVLDLGAGTGWLAYRLARRGHAAVAVDLLDDRLDGLGARRHFNSSIAAVLAEFDRLPVPASYADLIVFNASLHYSSDFAATLREAQRALCPGGTLVILDTPMYVDPNSGARMVQEREARFLKTYGFASTALTSEHFLTRQRLDGLGHQLGIEWRVHTPRWPLRDAVRRTLNGWRARREPAHFPVIVGRSQ